MIAVLGGLAVGFGCHHIGGKHDCGYNPSCYEIGGPTPPYPSTPAPGVPVKDKDTKGKSALDTIKDPAAGF
jgi:hypothetical protein